MRTLPIILLLLLACTLPLAAQEDHGNHAHAVLGRVDFRNSGSARAQEPLQRGVALLHHFKYDEAAAALREAQARDPALAVAYWLEALTYSHVLWGEENLEASRAALARLGATPAERLARAKTPRERTFGAAVEAFFADAPLPVRTRAYADSLQRLAAADSADLELTAFASHGVMMAWFASAPAERGDLSNVSRELALRVFERNPDHPGAAHYLTHVVDMDPSLASAQLPFARAYGRMAPETDHALHMPSHVFLPLGLWSEMAVANERSWAAARRDVVTGQRKPEASSWHALDWLQYAYLQMGRWSDARALIDSARTILRGVTPQHPDAYFVANELAFRYGAETGDWTRFAGGEPPTLEQVLEFRSTTPRGWQATYANAYMAAVGTVLGRGDRAGAARTATLLRGIADTIQAPASRTFLLRSAGQLDALVARRAGDLPRAIELLQDAAATETRVASTPGTSLPTWELLGDVLLEANRPADAVKAYERALTIRPNRSHALHGLARAHAAAGAADQSAAARAKLEENLKGADAAARAALKL